MMAGAHVRQRVSPHFSLSSGHLQIIEMMAATLDFNSQPDIMEMRAEGMNIPTTWMS